MRESIREGLQTPAGKMAKALRCELDAVYSRHAQKDAKLPPPA
jgi:hypothetical protein